jgi:hypothetical protein
MVVADVFHYSLIYLYIKFAKQFLKEVISTTMTLY